MVEKITVAVGQAETYGQQELGPFPILLLPSLLLPEPLSKTGFAFDIRIWDKACEFHATAGPAGDQSLDAALARVPFNRNFVVFLTRKKGSIYSTGDATLLAEDVAY